MELSDTESSSDEGPQPQQSQRRQRHNAKKRNRAKQNLDKFDLKPQYKIGDDISGPYWDPDTDPKRKCPTWYGGKIANVTVVNTSSPYGPICKYDIKFDDGDFVADVPEEMIFTQSDYELSHDYTDNKFKLIRDVTDKHTKDNWAKMVGYYVLTLNKEEHKFTFLTDAVAKHDKSVVERKGEKTNKADLYQPKNLKALLKEYRAAQSEKMSQSSKLKRKRTEESGLGAPDQSSKYVGVYCDKRDASKKWFASVKFNQQQYQIGNFFYEAEAAFAHDKAVELLGSGDMLNFKTKAGFRQSKKEEKKRLNNNEKGMSSSDIFSKVSESLGGDDALKFDEKPTSDTLAHTRKFKGTQFDKSVNKFRPSLNHNSKRYRLGSYDLEADAALAYDSALKAVGRCDECNFSSTAEYNQTRARELQRRQKKPDSISPAEIESFVAKQFDTLETNDVVGVSVPAEKLHGVSSKAKKWRSCCSSTYLGLYKLKSDAGFAYDEAVRQLGLDRDTNYASQQDYDESKRKEIRQNDYNENDGLSAVEIKDKVSGFVSKLQGDSASKNESEPKNETSPQPVPKPEKRNRPLENNAPEAKRTKTSRYFGVSFVKGDQKYFATLRHSKIVYKLGSYKLETDAALAHDEAARLLKFDAELNFGNSAKQYLRARAKESAEVGGPAEPVLTAANMIRGHLLKIKNPAVVALDEAIEKKWGRCIEGELSNMDKIDPDSVQAQNKDECVADDTEVIEIIDDSDSNCGERKDAASTLTSDEHPSQDRSKSVATEATAAVSNVAGIDAERSGAAALKSMPVGCPVAWSIDGNSFCSGEIVAVSKTTQTKYGITPSNGGASVLVAASGLAFGFNCHVTVARAPGETLKGKVLFFKRSSDSFVYQVRVEMGSNRFQVLSIDHSHLEFRRVSQAERESPRKLTLPAAAEPRKPSAQQQQDVQQAKAIPAIAERIQPPEILTLHDGDDIHSTNSTITAEHSLSHSTPRSSHQPYHGRSPNEYCRQHECRVYFPRWLVRHNETKDRLEYYLQHEDRRGSRPSRLNEIGRKYHCSLRLVKQTSEPHIFIETQPGKYAIQDIRKAKESLEDRLLDFIDNTHKDGSNGRLFYEIALSCPNLHQRNNHTVIQRNPFSADKEMDWQNISSLPYSQRRWGREYHGDFLIRGPTSVLHQIKRETNASVNVKLCGEQFRVRTRYCPPYVWLIGSQPRHVERAKEIIESSIAHFMNSNRNVHFQRENL